jgi:class 3 adenylate cyclase
MTPASSASPRVVDPQAVAEEELLRQARKGELYVAWVRAGLYLLMVLGHLLGQSQAAAAEAKDFPLPAWLPWTTCALSLTWLWLLLRVRYRAVFSTASATFDVVTVCGVSFLVLTTPAAAGATLVGGTPIIPFLFFLIAAAGVRLSPAATILSAAITLPITAAVVMKATRLGAETLPPELATTWGPVSWAVRASIFSFTAAMVALSAANARRVARAAGRAVAEQLRTLNLFGAYVDPGIAREALQRGTAGAETRRVTVLFTDLRGFTSLTERLPPTEVLSLLNQHYEAIVPVIQRHGGTVNKFVGDAVMATFGAPEPTDDHAARATRAALEMLTAMDELNARQAEGAKLEMGIGIASGVVVVGSLGTAERLEYAVIGDAVNTASRLEGLNKSLGTRLLLSEATRRALPDEFDVHSRGAVPVKGKADPVEVFTVSGPVRPAA